MRVKQESHCLVQWQHATSNSGAIPPSALQGSRGPLDVAALVGSHLQLEGAATGPRLQTCKLGSGEDVQSAFNAGFLLRPANPCVPHGPSLRTADFSSCTGSMASTSCSQVAAKRLKPAIEKPRWASPMCEVHQLYGLKNQRTVLESNRPCSLGQEALSPPAG